MVFFSVGLSSDLGNPVAFATGEFNGQPGRDVAFVEGGHTSNALWGRSIRIAANDGNGRFLTAEQVDVGGRVMIRITGGDLDGDGIDELAVTTARSTVLVLRKDVVSGGFVPLLELPTGGSGDDIAVADLNCDGKPDLITCDLSSVHAPNGGITVFLQD